MNVAVLESAVLSENIVPQLTAEGYEVFVRPTGSAVPAFLGGFQPDAIAVRADKKLVIELVREGTEERAKLARIRDLLANQSSWELRVYRISPSNDPRPINPVPAATVEMTIRTVENLITQGQSAPALLMAWAAFEALGRTLVPERFVRPQTPRRLIEVVTSEGILTQDEGATLRSLAEARNQLIHGALDVTISDPDVQLFVAILKRLTGTVRVPA